MLLYFLPSSFLLPPSTFCFEIFTFSDMYSFYLYSIAFVPVFALGCCCFVTSRFVYEIEATMDTLCTTILNVLAFLLY